MLKLPVLISLLQILAVNSAFAKADPSCKDIDKAISANEDFVEIALGIDRLQIAPALQTIKNTLKSVESGMPPKSKTDAAVQVELIELNFRRSDLPASAVAAIETYRVLISNYNSRLTTPLDTAMLDYVGFKLLALTAAQNLNWPEISKTVSEGQSSLEKTKAVLKDQALIDLADSITTALSSSLAAKDSAWLGSSAQILLDSVDLLERQLKNTSKEACN
jgi:hypothetical protein